MKIKSVIQDWKQCVTQIWGWEFGCACISAVVTCGFTYGRPDIIKCHDFSAQLTLYWGQLGLHQNLIDCTVFWLRNGIHHSLRYIPWFQYLHLVHHFIFLLRLQWTSSTVNTWPVEQVLSMDPTDDLYWITAGSSNIRYCPVRQWAHTATLYCYVRSLTLRHSNTVESSSVKHTHWAKLQCIKDI